ATGAAAMGDDAPARSESCAGEMLSDSDKVGESVDLLVALAVLVPAITLVLAAAHMGDGVDEAAIDEAQRIGGETGRNRHAVGAVAIEQQRRRAVERCLLAVK